MTMLNRDQAREIVENIEGVYEYNPPEAVEKCLDALEACVVVDPRIDALRQIAQLHQPDYSSDIPLCVACGDERGAEDWPCATYKLATGDPGSA